MYFVFLSLSQKIVCGVGGGAGGGGGLWVYNVHGPNESYNTVFALCQCFNVFHVLINNYNKSEVYGHVVAR